MLAEATVPRWLRWPALLVDALADTRKAHVGVVALLGGYAAIWTAYAVVAKSTQGIHPDMAEIAAWSSELEWGTPKHPPLLPALVRIWFSVFPAADWSYYFLAVSLVTLAIYFSWLLAGLFLDGVKRALVPFILMLIPFYNFLALKLDHNVVLIPLWAATTYAVIKAYRSNGMGWALAAGVCAGLAVLAKYWSFFLLVGLGVAVLAGPHRARFFRSPAPWIITAVSFCLFLPHILWLDQHGFPTFVYARHRLATDWTELAQGMLGYAAGFLGYVALPLALLIMLEPTFRRSLKELVWPGEPRARFLALLFWIPLAAALPFALLTQTRLSALWVMSELSLVAIVALHSSRVVVHRRSAAAIAATAIGVAFAALLVSPLVAYSKLVNGVENEATYTRELAYEIEAALKREKRPRPSYLAGSHATANSVAFYMQSQPAPIVLPSRVPTRWHAELTGDDTITVCHAADVRCQRSLSVHPLSRWRPIVVEPGWLGWRAKAETFVLEIKPALGSGRDYEYCCISTSRRRRVDLGPATGDR